MKRFFCFNFLNRLFLIFLLSLLPVLGLVAFNGWEYRKLVVKDVYQNLSNLNRLAAFYYGETIKESQGLLLSLSSIDGLTDLKNKKNCQELLGKIIENYPFYSNLIVAKTNGDIFCSALPIDIQLNLLYRPYFQEVLTNRDFTISGFLKGAVHGRQVLALCYPFLNEDKEVKAILLAIFDLSFLEKIDKELNLPQGTVFFIIDNQGIILSSNFKDKNLIGQSIVQTSLYKELLSKSDEGLKEAMGPDEVKRLYAYGLVKNVPLRDKIFIAIGFDKDLIFKDIRFLFKRHLFLTPLLLTIAVFLFLLMINFVLVHKKRFFIFWRKG